MRKEDFYGVYDYGDALHPGSSLKIERSVTLDLDAPDLTPFTNTGTKELERLRKNAEYLVKIDRALAQREAGTMQEHEIIEV